MNHSSDTYQIPRKKSEKTTTLQICHGIVQAHTFLLCSTNLCDAKVCHVAVLHLCMNIVIILYMLTREHIRKKYILYRLYNILYAEIDWYCDNAYHQKCF